MAVAADQMVRQARSAYYLTANGSLSGAYAEHARRRGRRVEQTRSSMTDIRTA